MKISADDLETVSKARVGRLGQSVKSLLVKFCDKSRVSIAQTGHFETGPVFSNSFLLRRGMRVLLERQLRQIKTQIFEITGQKADVEKYFQLLPPATSTRFNGFPGNSGAFQGLAS